MMASFWQRYGTYLRWLFSIGMLIAVVTMVDLQSMVASASAVAWWYYPVTAGFMAMTFGINALRWQLVSSGRTFMQLVRINLVSYFYAFVIPSLVTADVARVVHLSKGSKTWSSNILGVVLDRYCGVVGLGLACCLSIVLAPTRPATATLIGISIIVPLMAMLPLAGISLRFTAPMRSIVARLRQVLPARAQGVADDLIGSLDGRLLTPESRYRIMMLYAAGFVAQVVNAGWYWFLGVAFMMPITIQDAVILSVISQGVSLLPLSIAGIGVKDVSTVSYLVYLGVPAERAAIASFSTYPVTILTVVLGWLLSTTSSEKGASGGTKDPADAELPA